MAYEEAAHADHHAPHVNSTAIFIALCVCTLISMALDYVPMHRGIVAVLALSIAVAKAQFVMRYFMHLKFEGRWKYVLLLPTAILACGLPLALAPDIGMHYYTPVETGVTAEVAHAEAHGGGHGILPSEQDSDGAPHPEDATELPAGESEVE